jgi:N-acetyl-D-muramate 6-phosphate phosphatase
MLHSQPIVQTAPRALQRLPRPVSAVLFDLDGTVADTATDLAMPINAMRFERGLSPMPLELLRPFASMGARGLLLQGLGINKDHADFESFRDDFLRRYETDMCLNTTLFAGMDVLLKSLDELQMPWGIVSNKAERYVRPIANYLGFAARSKTLIGGDTTAFAKPHPEPLLHAARLLNVAPSACVYVGDDRRDIQAAKAAGMMSIAAAYGYCGDEDPPQHWDADAVVASAAQINALLY